MSRASNRLEEGARLRGDERSVEGVMLHTNPPHRTQVMGGLPKHVLVKGYRTRFSGEGDMVLWGEGCASVSKNEASVDLSRRVQWERGTFA